ncbi:MAG: phosphatase PAP2 family protein [Cyclobacteriaceae bacterium]
MKSKVIHTTNGRDHLYMIQFVCITTVVWLWLVTFSLPCFSQQITEDHCGICKGKRHLQGSPYRFDLKGEIPFIAVSTVSLGAGFVAQGFNNTQPFTAEELEMLDIQSINAFDRNAVYNSSEAAKQASDIIIASLTIFPILLVSEHHTKQDLGPLLAMSLETMAVTYGLTNLIKNTVNRTRPNVYNPDTPFDERTSSTSRQSFISGHTSHAAAASFFMAKVISDYHPDMATGAKIALWSFSAYIPALTGYFRVKAGKHFTTDVMAGYAVGAFTGWLIPHLHKKKADSMLGKLNLQLYPSTAGMQFSLRVGL